MLKYIVALVVVFGCAIGIAFQDERTAEKSAHETASVNESAVPTKSNENHPEKNAEDPYWYLQVLYAFFRWPVGTGTWVIVLTLLAIAEQTKQTAKAAKATEDAAVATQTNTTAMLRSVEMQEIQFRQWVEISDWANRVRQPRPNVGNPTIVVQYKVRNTTERPLTLTEVSTKHSGLTETFSPGKLIPPGEYLPVDVGIKLAIPDELAAYWKNEYATGVAMDVIYEDILGKKRSQQFLYFIQCGPNQCIATEASNRHVSEVIAEISSEPTPPQSGEKAK